MFRALKSSLPGNKKRVRKGAKMSLALESFQNMNGKQQQQPPKRPPKKGQRMDRKGWLRISSKAGFRRSPKCVKWSQWQTRVPSNTWQPLFHSFAHPMSSPKKYSER